MEYPKMIYLDGIKKGRRVNSAEEEYALRASSEGGRQLAKTIEKELAKPEPIIEELPDEVSPVHKAKKHEEPAKKAHKK